MNQQENQYTIKHAPYMMVIAILFSLSITLLFVLVNTIWQNDSITTPIIVIIGLVMIISYFLIVGMTKEKVTIDQNNVTIHPPFGKTRHCQLSDIKYVKEFHSGAVEIIQFYGKDKRLFDATSTCSNFKRIKEATLDIERK